MSECIRGSYDNALYKSTFTLLTYFINSQEKGAVWLRGTAVERRSLAGELFLSCARPV